MGKPLTPSDFQERLTATKSGCVEYRYKTMKDGYGSLSYQGRYWLAHRLAWTLANGPIPADMCVCHSCDNPACCNVAHLFLGSHAANMGDMKRKGRRLHVNSREGNGRAKLTEQAAQEIKSLYASGSHTQMKLASMFGVSQTTVSQLLRGKHWN